MEHSTTYIDSPIGTLAISAGARAIQEIRLTKRKAQATSVRASSPVVRQCMRELAEFFAGKRDVFDVPVQADKPTPFNARVWKAMRTIPAGKTMSYSELATKVGAPRAARAVGTACGKNPLLIVVPCHRVVGANGALGGFSAGIAAKRWLLKREGSAIC